jgi:hypothetical protein
MNKIVKTSKPVSFVLLNEGVPLLRLTAPAVRALRSDKPVASKYVDLFYFILDFMYIIIIIIIIIKGRQVGQSSLIA